MFNRDLARWTFTHIDAVRRTVHFLLETGLPKHPLRLPIAPMVTRTAAPETWRSWITSFFYEQRSEEQSSASIHVPNQVSQVIRVLEYPPTVQVAALTPTKTTDSMRRNFSAADTNALVDVEDDPATPSPVERLFCEQRLKMISMMDPQTQMLIRELFAIITGEDDMADDCDDAEKTVNLINPGYEKTDDQRRLDCERVTEILSSGVDGISANLTWTYGETLLWMAIEYDHRHPAQMTDVVLRAGADANAPNAVDGLRPIQSPWLSSQTVAREDAFNAEKRALLISAGAAILCCEDGGRSGRKKRPLQQVDFGMTNSHFSRSRSSVW